MTQTAFKMFDLILENELINPDYEYELMGIVPSKEETAVLLQRHWIENPIYEINANKLIEQTTASNSEYWAVDVETTGFDPNDDFIVGIGLSDGENHYFLPPTQGRIVINALNKKGVSFLLHNAKFDRKFLERWHVNLTHTFDTMLMAYVLDLPTKLSTLAQKFLGRNPYEYEEIVEKQKGLIELEAFKVLGKYCCEDCFETHKLFFILKEKLEQENLWQIFKIENRVERVLAEMELEGVKVDSENIFRLTFDFKKTLLAIAQTYNLKVEFITGENYLITSPKQLRELLYDKLELPTDGIKETKQGHSTAKEALDILRFVHPVADLIYQHRLYKKAIEFSSKLTQCSRNGLIYTSFNQTVTATGRLSSSKPNLQNIPARGSIGKAFRGLFIPRQNNWSILALDYSQFELRILAQITQDKKLLDAFNNNIDVHTLVTELMFDIQYEPDNPDHVALRRITKTINFGLIYGMSEFKLSAMTKRTIDECLDLMEQHKFMLGSVWEWFTYNKAQSIVNGYSSTILGRKRYYQFSEKVLLRNKTLAQYLPHFPQKVLSSLDRVLTYKDSAYLRQANNHPIQGTNADLIKIVMAELYHQMQTSYYKGKIRLLLQVHDELVYEFDNSLDVSELIANIKRIMINFAGYYLPDVPVKVSAGVGDNWGMAK